MESWYAAYRLADLRHQELRHEAREARHFRSRARAVSRKMRQGRLELNRSEVLSLRPTGDTVVCVTGRIWVTREGDGEDYVLGPAERMRLRGRGRVVVQALEPSTVAIRPEVPAEMPASLHPAVHPV